MMKKSRQNWVIPGFLTFSMICGCSQSYVGNYKLKKVMVETQTQTEQSIYWAWGDNEEAFRPAFPCGPHPGAPREWCLYVQIYGNGDRAHVIYVTRHRNDTHKVFWVYNDTNGTLIKDRFIKGCFEAHLNLCQLKENKLLPWKFEENSTQLTEKEKFEFVMVPNLSKEESTKSLEQVKQTFGPVIQQILHMSKNVEQ